MRQQQPYIISSDFIISLFALLVQAFHGLGHSHRELLFSQTYVLGFGDYAELGASRFGVVCGLLYIWIPLGKGLTCLFGIQPDRTILGIGL
jgi:hypothetical protein